MTGRESFIVGHVEDLQSQTRKIKECCYLCQGRKQKSVGFLRSSMEIRAIHATNSFGDSAKTG